MQQWLPHVTVATVIVKDGQYLLVEERDKHTGELVFNQPAGHLESGESLVECAHRETLEETGWRVAITGVIGIALYTAPTNGTTYHRTTFLGEPSLDEPGYELDKDIHAVHWMDYGEMQINSARMRSPLVLAAVEQHRRGICFPLDLIYA
jgi:8-oxo-dGTP pyrophosphatase MutT (NUDIX family)